MTPHGDKNKWEKRGKSLMQKKSRNSPPLKCRFHLVIHFKDYSMETENCYLWMNLTNTFTE